MNHWLAEWITRYTRGEVSFGRFGRRYAYFMGTEANEACAPSAAKAESAESRAIDKVSTRLGVGRSKTLPAPSLWTR